MLKNFEDNTHDPWWALCKFSLWDKKTNETYNDNPDFSDSEDATFVFKLSDVEHIELFDAETN